MPRGRGAGSRSATLETLKELYRAFQRCVDEHSLQVQGVRASAEVCETLANILERATPSDARKPGALKYRGGYELLSALIQADRNALGQLLNNAHFSPLVLWFPGDYIAAHFRINGCVTIRRVDKKYVVGNVPIGDSIAATIDNTMEMAAEYSAERPLRPVTRRVVRRAPPIEPPTESQPVEPQPVESQPVEPQPVKPTPVAEPVRILGRGESWADIVERGDKVNYE
jgi:hypothetical protein